VKILLPLVTLLQLTNAHASLVGIMDSGTDISHKDLKFRTWYNTKEKAGSTVDLDGDGLAGDITGWDFIKNVAAPFDNQYVGMINADVITFFNYYAKYELNTVSSTEIEWLKSHSKDDSFMNKVDFLGGYMHGTHVAGISTINNPKAQILTFKVIPTVFQELAPAPTKPVTPAPAPTKLPDATNTQVEEFSQELIKYAGTQIEEMTLKQKQIAIHNVDVVNQSFGIGFNDAVGFIGSSFVEEYKATPNKNQLEKMVRTYMNTLLSEGKKMYAVAPNAVFVIAAGNDSNNNDVNPDYPADIVYENKITVAASQGYQKLADFSNYGATKVDVAAPGVAISSSVPTNSYVPMSGTSQAAPFVTNTIALAKDTNPKLSVKDLRSIVFGTVDVKSWLKGKVRTSGIVNRDRAVKAAELSLTLSLDQAISKARTLVADVPTLKSLDTGKRFGEFTKYRPMRPSLLKK
jgi:cell wall-associated protease